MTNEQLGDLITQQSKQLFKVREDIQQLKTELMERDDRLKRLRIGSTRCPSAWRRSRTSSPT